MAKKEKKKTVVKYNKKGNTKPKKDRDSNLYSIAPPALLPKDTVDKAIKLSEGRPSKYTKGMSKKAIQFMSLGLSKAQVANRLGISYDTLCNWCKKEKEDGSKNPGYIEEFFSAIKIGEQLSEDWWMTMGQLNLMNKDFNVGAYTIQMANRFNWSRKDKIDIESRITRTDKKILEVNLNYSIQETKEIIEGLLEDGVIEADATDSIQ